VAVWFKEDATMRNTLALVGAVIVGFGGIGWYLGWYEISRQPSTNGRQAIQVDINSDKVTQDVKKIVQTAQEFKSDGTKPAPLVTPQGPASEFFSPKKSNQEAAKNAADSFFGSR
jgi:hypothetical protein